MVRASIGRLLPDFEAAAVPQEDGEVGDVLDKGVRVAWFLREDVTRLRAALRIDALLNLVFHRHQVVGRDVFGDAVIAIERNP